MLGRFSPLTSPVARLPRILFSVLCSPGALPRPCIWVSDIFCPIESDTFYKALTLYWL